MGVFARVTIDLGTLPRRIRILAEPNALAQQLLGIAEAGRAKWTKLAQQNLHTSRQAYVLGLQQPAFMGEGMTAIVELSGDLANAIERGADPFELLDGLLQSPRAKVGQHGVYAVVPLRMTAPGTKGRAGQPMDTVYAPPGPDSRSGRQGIRSGGALIAQEVYELAKRLKSGGDVGELDLPKLQPRHSVDPFTRLTKAGSAKNRYYVAFRTATESRPDKWQHPGFYARNLVEGAARHVQEVGPKALRKFARAFFAPPGTPPEPGGDSGG